MADCSITIHPCNFLYFVNMSEVLYPEAYSSIISLTSPFMMMSPGLNVKLLDLSSNVFHSYLSRKAVCSGILQSVEFVSRVVSPTMILLLVFFQKQLCKTVLYQVISRLVGSSYLLNTVIVVFHHSGYLLTGVYPSIE